MKSLVYLKSSCSGISFSASLVSTGERLLPSVGELVGLQMPLCDELLVALTTDEGSLACVGPHVSLQVAGLRELLQALFERTKQNFLLVLGPLNLFNRS